ncbi:SelT/SelW/SelH family protein [bacterium]|nr:SelT/SelW/SelH family protein [bacterium]
MAAAIRESYPDIDLSMEPSRGGRFEVSVDAVPIFEKSKLGRHAKPGEVLALIEELRNR